MIVCLFVNILFCLFEIVFFLLITEVSSRINSLLGKGVNMGLGSICHQYSKIGSYAMIGMGAIVTKKINPNCFGTYVGNPAKYIKENDYMKQKWSYEMVLDICAEFDKMVEGYDARSV